ncbi:BadF/BadG/BcrA/BcrD ATPase family protein [Thalassobius sp. I31.1]|uniref:BadF/BadG/BcrA/BcrD ATPase family protein n=1 Tax=Thalassobius sp. I31.1 TaxID=2109912 RepID=UPI000D1B838C|nr:BadF/BadG/BcrA/BcrD ATPase family protein [Thalassobius sp. I31.1]
MVDKDTYLIGVDGGGTGCRALLVNSEMQELSRGTGGPANVSVNFADSIANVMGAVQQIIDAAGLTDLPDTRFHLHLGLAGVLSEDMVQRVKGACVWPNVTVTDDRAAAVAGALGPDDGSLLVIGTGTIIASRKAGQLRVASGWGFRVGDQGSGAWLGRRLLEESLHAHDGIRAQTDLTREILANFNNRAAEITMFSMQAGQRDYADLAPRLTQALQAGDPVAQELMSEGADHLLAGLRATGFEPGDTLCIAGGIGPYIRDCLPGDVTAGLRDVLGSPLDGAVLLAQNAVR